jgi:hypothetical protein
MGRRIYGGPTVSPNLGMQFSGLKIEKKETRKKKKKNISIVV